jgi:hypothetical protein
MNDDKFMEQVRALKNERAPDDLYQRIMTVVPNHAQAGPVERKAGFLARFFGDWQYGLALKFASFALAGIIGFYTGHYDGPPQESSFFAAIATGEIGWEE